MKTAFQLLALIHQRMENPDPSSGEEMLRLLDELEKRLKGVPEPVWEEYLAFAKKKIAGGERH